MDPRISLYISIIIGIYALFYTYSNDYGMFLYLLLLIALGIFSYEYIDYRINYYSDKIEKNIANVKYQLDDKLSNLRTKIEDGITNTNFIKNIITNMFNKN